MDARQAFFSSDGKLRFGWRMLLFLLLLLVAIAPLTLIKNSILQFLGAAILLVIGLRLNAKFLDKRPFPNYGLVLTKTSITHLFFGLLIGSLTVLALLFLGMVTSILKVSNPNHSLDVSLLALFGLKMILVAIIEESLYRGYLLTNLREALQSGQTSRNFVLASAVLISSVLFGLAHTGNHSASFLSVLFLTINGVVWCIPFLMTKNLGLSIGLHASWNFMQSTLGFTMSGNIAEHSIYHIENTGPSISTGGAYGPEAGLLGVTGYLLMLVLSVGSLKIVSSIRK